MVWIGAAPLVSAGVVVVEVVGGMLGGSALLGLLGVVVVKLVGGLFGGGVLLGSGSAGVVVAVAVAGDVRE